MAIGIGGIVVGTGTSLGVEELRQKAADPNDDSPLANAGRAACDLHSSTGIGYTQGIGTGIAMDGFCRPYYDQSGNDAPTYEEPGFEGGQCPVRYDVFLEDPNNPGTQGRTITQNRQGPFRDYDYEYNESQPNTYIARIKEADGTEYSITGVTSGFDPAFQSLKPLFQRLDGLPDNCGNPPPVIEPGPTNPGTQPGVGSPRTVYGSPVNVTVNVDTDVFGNPAFVTTFDVGGVQISPSVSFNPSIEINPPATPNPPSEDGDPVQPVEPSGEIEDVVSPEDEETGLETIGYRWALGGLPLNISAVPQTSPKVFVTPYGNIQLRYEGASGAEFWSDNLPIRVEEGSLIRSDPSLKVRAVRFSRRPDVGAITLTPVRARRI